MAQKLAGAWKHHAPAQTVEKPFLKVKLYKREKEKFWSSFFKSLQDSKGRSPWPLPAGSGIYPFAPGARTKRKKRVRRPAADDPAPSFCLQNDGLEFSKLLSTAHLRQQTTPLCAICQTILSFSTGWAGAWKHHAPASSLGRTEGDFSCLSKRFPKTF